MLRRRYFRILWFFGNILLGEIFWDIILPRLGLRKLSMSRRPKRERLTAIRFRRLAVQMGGVMIKVGQFLSARLDVLPHEITDELSGLQDEVAAAPFEPIREIIEQELGAPIAEKFASFNETPIAAASIGQVYAAQLCSTSEDGSPCPTVVVKVQRPHIDEIVETDLSAIRIVGRWVEKYRPIRKHVNVPRLLEEFSRSLYEEIDYLHEGHNAEKFAENFKEDPNVRVPHVVWSHTTRRVLILEDVGGIKITDYAAIEAAGINRAEVAKRLLDTYLKQVFEDAFFHADPHPGNLFIQVERSEAEEKPWKLVFVDFGMTGTLPETTFKGVREMLIGVGTRDAHRLIQSYQTLDMLLPGVDIEQLERASQHVFERFWGKATTEMVELHPEEAQEFLDEFGDLIYEMPFQIPENLILLGRCVSILSGMCSGLDPNFNVWSSLAPYAEKLLEAEGGGKWQTVLDEAGKWVQKLIALPARADALMTRMEQGRLEVRVPAVSHELQRLQRSQKRTTLAVIFAAFLLGGIQLYLGGQMVPAAAFAGVALLILIWILLTR
ncbi:MAG: AarF/ABC1/UbiB kinase family protein [Anaerolineaceae bacterium]